MALACLMYPNAAPVRSKPEFGRWSISFGAPRMHPRLERLLDARRIVYGGYARIGDVSAGAGATSTTRSLVRASPKRRLPVANNRTLTTRSQYPRSGK